MVMTERDVAKNIRQNYSEIVDAANAVLARDSIVL